MTKHDQSCDRRLNEVREMLARARPDQIRRLVEDIRQSGQQEDTRGTA
ncbi:hypothetical protein SAMN05443432_103148 [Roseovarius litoreus]|jgi:hypothetical protein|uniref:Uncharacterized protein n=1 Tax=Roseovarius litoreus TaxID=1155722 RepID=A0A1M7E0S9_9RHOB|nr:hypothetical protein [Roseovarius litoreus]SHL85361.1 hypothetical protein SAMN05443432_103148 [Roseovarius litoreus]